jgi:hypothetical protein
VDDVDGDAARPEIARQPLGEADQGRLAHRIERRSRLDDAVGQAGAGRDDPPAFPEMRGRRLRGEHDGTDIDRQRRIDIGEAPLGDRAATPDAGIVDEDVESTERGRRLVDGVGRPEDTVGFIADLMLAADVGRIPIVDPASGKLIGLVARKDLLRLRSALKSSESERRPYLGKRPTNMG